MKASSRVLRRSRAISISHWANLHFWCGGVGWCNRFGVNDSVKLWQVNYAYEL